MLGGMTDQDWVTDAADDAGGLDLLLTDAALGLRRLLSLEGATGRLAGRLARRPRLVGGQAAWLASQLTQITAGRSELRPHARDRRFTDPAWAGNPLLRRILQAYLAAGMSAEALLDGAELGWRDDTRLRFLPTNLIAAAAPSNNPLLSPVAWKAWLTPAG
jgi:polyhydroxyalkanoate synthase